MKLKTGNLLWPALYAPRKWYVPLGEDCDCEVAIIGAGITGALVAEALTAQGIDTVVVDRRTPGCGSTAACTALAMYEIDHPLIKLAKETGIESAQQAYRACRRAIDDLANAIVANNIDCDLIRRPSIFLAKTSEDISWLQQEAVARAEIDIEAEFLSGAALKERFGLQRPGAILSSAAYELDPFRLTLGLFAAAEKRGCRIYSDTSVLAADIKENRIVLQTDTGARIRCRQVVIATGYETPEQFSAVAKRTKLESTYAFATEPLPPEVEPWGESALIWESGDSYLYARRFNGRVIAGGADVPFADATRRDALIEEKIAKLSRQLSDLCPDIELHPEYTWAGTFASTRDALPYIGTLPEWPGFTFALGYGGNGITFSLLASQIIRDAFLGQPNAEAHLFRFGRHQD